MGAGHAKDYALIYQWLAKKLGRFLPDRRPGAERLPQEMAIKAEPTVSQGLKEKAGWTSPAYSTSQSIRLDPVIVSENRCIAILPSAPEIEAYKLLRAKILHRTRDKGWNTIMITSALPGEGKSITSINLSLTFAREFDQTVMLVDCDFRRQQVYRYLNIESDKGLVDYLLNGCPISELIIWPNIEKFTLISGGRTIEESSELLGSPKMKELFADMKSRYPDRYIFFDAPPLLCGADALTFASMVDCILVVVQSGKTSINDVKRALEMIPKEKVLGLVLNRQKEPLGEYASYYSYSYPVRQTP